MGIMDLIRPREKRGEVPNGSVSVSSSNFLDVISGLAGAQSTSGVAVTIESALGVPAVWAAVNFISGTIAGLPLHVYRKSGEDRSRVTGSLANLLHDAVNEEVSSFQWRKHAFEQVLTGGRSFTYIERNASGAVANLWPLDPGKMTVKRDMNRRLYDYRDDSGKTIRYTADEIIDIPFMLKADGLTHRGPITANKNVIGQAIATTEFASKFFQNGGVPPFAVTGAFQSGRAMQRAGEDLQEAVRRAAKEQRQALVMPAGLEIKSIGVDAEKSQLIETQRFMVEQIARIYSLPPVFLQDLTHGTYSNTEQQDLHLVKHTLRRWVEQFEQELNLKLFGRNSNVRYVEFNIDGLLRGDFKTRMEGYSAAIQNALMTPNEARRRENMSDMESGDKLMIQGGTMPLEGQLMLPGMTPQEGENGA